MTSKPLNDTGSTLKWNAHQKIYIEMTIATLGHNEKTHENSKKQYQNNSKRANHFHWIEKMSSKCPEGACRLQEMCSGKVNTEGVN